MESANQLANRFREVLLAGKRVANTNYQDQLSNITWEQVRESIESINLIAALTYYIYYYTSGILKVLVGGDMKIHEKYLFDEPLLKLKEDWECQVDRLKANADIVADQVQLMSEEKQEGTYKDENLDRSEEILKD